MSPQSIAVEDFVCQLRTFPAEAFERTGEILEFLQGTNVTLDSLAPYANWDKQHYTRNLIDKTSLYELLAICWEVGQSSSVHNHRDQNCWMAVPQGHLLVENFHVVRQDVDGGECHLKTADTVDMKPGYPCAVDPAEPVHRVYNPREFNQRAMSLHVYSRPFDTCVVYSPDQGTCGVIKLHYTTQYGKKAK